jgi:3-isopropylmalate dehydratase small subunit
MTPFTAFESTAVVLPLDDIDTDQIIPARFLKGTDKAGLGEHLFEDRRVHPDFPLLAIGARAAKILVTGANFGCGSSRETAVWAVKEMGYRVLIAESFGDIFRANCFKNAVLPIGLLRPEVEILLEAAADRVPITIDVATATVSTAGRTFSFDLAEPRRAALINGLDDLDLALLMHAEIATFEAADRTRRPWVHGAKTLSSLPTTSTRGADWVRRRADVALPDDAAVRCRRGG